MENIMKRVKSLGESGELTKNVTETIANETKEKGVNFLVFY